MKPAVPWHHCETCNIETDHMACFCDDRQPAPAFQVDCAAGMLVLMAGGRLTRRNLVYDDSEYMAMAILAL